MWAVSRVAVNVFRESIRDRVPYNLVLFAILLIGSSILLAQLTAGQDVKIIKDLGLAATSVFGLFIAVFIGIGLVSKEVERRSIYGLLAKPIERHHLLLGKYLGLALTLAVNLAIMALALYAVLAYMAWTADPLIAKAWERPALDPAMLEAKANNYLVALVAEGESAGIAAADVSTGEFFCYRVPEEMIATELERLQPAELLVPRRSPTPITRAAVTERDPWQFDLSTAREAIFRHFEVATLEPFGCADEPLAARAAGALIAYLNETGRGTLSRLSRQYEAHNRPR